MHAGPVCACLVACFGAWAVVSMGQASDEVLPPATWGVVSSCVWAAYLALLAPRGISESELRCAAWGIGSSVLWGNFLIMHTWDLRSWADVYYFCGSRWQYCTCDGNWTRAGMHKAAVLWTFVLSAAVGVQRLLVQVVLDGFLPGEEAVTRESFISIAWRLVPYALNAWERTWGAEVSSVVFELPHFAIELLVVLPCVQILCSRMKVLALSSVQPALPPTHDGASAAVIRANYVPNVLRGCWERRPEQQHFWARIRANRRVITFAGLLCVIACANALWTPVLLRDTVINDGLSGGMEAAGRLRGNWSDAASLSALQLRLSKTDHYEAGNGLGVLHQRLAAYEATPLSCSLHLPRFHANVRQHDKELRHMQSPQQRANLPLIEGALALMRLSSERFFTLLSLYVAFLLFRVPPRAAAAVVVLNARVSTAFVRLVLYAFPAVCWACGAGPFFSVLVSAVFWTAPLASLVHSVRRCVCSVAISGLREATVAEVQRMHGDCAVCWGEMTVGGQRVLREGDGEPAGGPSSSSRSRSGVVAAALAAIAAAFGGADRRARPPAAAAEEAAAAEAAAPAATTSSSEAGTTSGSASSDGCSLTCGHAFHKDCLTQWLQQCHANGTAPKCPMCQAPMHTAVTWHVWRALGLGPRRQGQQQQQEEEEQGQEPGLPVMTNYLLLHSPRLAELLADTPQLLAPHTLQLLAEVQDLRQQRVELMRDLQLRQHQLHQLLGRHQRLEVEGLAMEELRQELVHEINLLMQLRHQQLDLLHEQLLQQTEQEQPQEQRQAQQQPQQAAGGGGGGWRWRAGRRRQAAAEHQPQQQQ